MTYISWSSDLPFILKTIWYMNIILWDYESVWPDVWLQNKCRSLWPYFMVLWFCLVSWRPSEVWISYFRIMSQYDPTFDLKINVGHCDLYFMVQWFCIISWRLFDVWTSNFVIMIHCDLYFMVQCLCLILKTDVWTAYFVITSQCDVVFDHKNIFSASNFFMYIFNMSVTYLQSVEQIQWKLQEEFISQSMHYQPIFTMCSCQKMAK